MMTELQDYMHQHIPITQALQVSVTQADANFVQLYAPLATNVNHRGSVFGGSLHAVAVLAAWSLLHLRLTEYPDLNIVVQHSAMDYLHPVTGDFSACCRFADEATWTRCLTMLNKKGKTRIALSVDVLQDGKLVATLSGKFALLY